MRTLLATMLVAAGMGGIADPAEARGRRGGHVAIAHGYAAPRVVYRYARPRAVLGYRPARAAYHAPRTVGYVAAAPRRDFYDSYDNRPARTYGYRSGVGYRYGYVSAPPSGDYIFGALATRGTGTITETQRFYANQKYRHP